MGKWVAKEDLEYWSAAQCRAWLKKWGKQLPQGQYQRYLRRARGLDPFGSQGFQKTLETRKQDL